AGPINFRSILWQAVQLALNTSSPLEASVGSISSNVTDLITPTPLLFISIISLAVNAFFGASLGVVAVDCVPIVTDLDFFSSLFPQLLSKPAKRRIKTYFLIVINCLWFVI